MLIATIRFDLSERLILLDSGGYYLRQRVGQRIYSTYATRTDASFAQMSRILARFRWSKDFIEAVGVLPVCL